MALATGRPISFRFALVVAGLFAAALVAYHAGDLVAECAWDMMTLPSTEWISGALS